MQEEKTEKVPYGYIYKLANITNGKCYFGQTTNMITRRSAYKHLRCKSQQKIHNALLKYGFDSFTFEAVATAYSKEELNLLEIKTIADNNSIEEGYNITPGGKSNGHMSDEIKKKISAALTGRKKSDEVRQNISTARKGIVFTEEHKQNIAKSQLGTKKSAETRQKHSDNNIGMLGKRHTDESIQRMRDAQTGRQHTEETKHRMSIAHKKIAETKARNKALRALASAEPQFVPIPS